LRPGFAVAAGEDLAATGANAPLAMPMLQSEKKSEPDATTFPLDLKLACEPTPRNGAARPPGAWAPGHQRQASALASNGA
jgi:hypothetical protein